MSQRTEHSSDYVMVDVDSVDAIKDTLVNMKLCAASDTVGSIAKAGEGNMNVVLRVSLADKSLILKQSRPWVAKYPSIEAPEERIHAELGFYRRVQVAPGVASTLPTLLGFDVDRRTIVMEDLGAASDYIGLYSSKGKSEESAAVFREAIGWLSRLHQIPVDSSADPEVGCYKLRQLNHAHLFVIPLQSGDIDLDSVCEGLQAKSKFVRQDDRLRAAMKVLGEQYLSVGRHLLHGDYYPGSWLQTVDGFRVIDPEFCFAGPAEFDLGVLVAHWIFCGAAAARSTVERVCETYGGDSVDGSLVAKFAGVELIRRLIGVAQLPLSAGLSQRVAWLTTGRSLVLDC